MAAAVTQQQDNITKKGSTSLSVQPTEYCGGVEAEPRSRQIVSCIKIEPGKGMIVGRAVS